MPLLRTVLRNDNNYGVRSAVVGMLAKSGSAEGLIDSLPRIDHNLRPQVLRALAAIGTPMALKAVRDIADDPDPKFLGGGQIHVVEPRTT